MTIIQWLSETMREVGKWLGMLGHRCVPVFQELRMDVRTKKCFGVAFIALAAFGFGPPLTAWTEDLPSLVPVKPGKIVAAGVGYENAETSTITVKTYDAVNGSILTDETYELNVREEASSASNQPPERIFAGGVGPGADGLSQFTLRVYDAATGRFLWEGLLNLNVSNQESVSTRRVTAHHLAPQAMITPVRSRNVGDGQPQFFLSAVDPATGHLMWSDQFSAGAGRFARPERVSRSTVGQTGGLVTSLQQIEFRIQMLNDQDRQILWEDTIEPALDEKDVTAGYDDAAENLPAWRGAGPEKMKREAI